MFPIADSTPRRGLPLVVQIGFAGSRHLLDPASGPAADVAQLEDALLPQLVGRLGQLSGELGLSERHFLCGVSSLAIGGDALFTRACEELGWLQRLFLPQPLEEFLRAAGADGTPDLTATEAEAARRLAARPHVIQQRVLGEASDRHERFDDVNLELARVSDLFVCLLRAGADGEQSYTHEARDHAVRRGRPVLELRVAVDADGKPTLEDAWHGRERFRRPDLPRELARVDGELSLRAPAADYCEHLERFAGATSKTRQRLFKAGALVVVVAHVLATLCAVVALQVHGAAALSWILGGELVFLALGFAFHQYLHGAHAVRVWATARLLAEVANSTLSLRHVPAQLSHIFALPLPASLRPLLRTLNVLHLRDAPHAAPADWKAARSTYVSERLDAPERGQIEYYGRELRKAERQQRRARCVFMAGSLGAFAATLFKLLLALDRLPVADSWHAGGASLLGALAILLPVVAVAALSLAAAYDLEARAHSYAEMHDFLQAQRQHLVEAPSEHAFHHLALETEAHLLGETASWHARRAFTGIA